jgi:H+-transporting ATPase
MEGPFEYSSGLTAEEAEKRLNIYGRNELNEKVVPRWLIFAILLVQPMPIMIWLAVIIEGIIENFSDMGILLLIQFANAGIAFYERTKAEDAVAKLKQSLRPVADVYRDGQCIEIDAAFLVPGDLIKLSSGSGISADCRINHGTIEVDESQLNGESHPRTADSSSEPVLMGSLVVRGECTATVEFTGKDTFFGKAAGLLAAVHNANNSIIISINVF